MRSNSTRRPSDLRLPPHLGEVMARLSGDGARRFTLEMVSALELAERENDLQPVRDVIEAWYRTVLVTADPAYAGNIGAALRSRPRRGQSVDQLRRRYGF